MAGFSLHAIGRDRPGIVAALTGSLAGIGCNLIDSRMTILHRQFAVMIVLEAPGIDDGTHIERALEPIAEELDVLVVVRPLPADDGWGAGDEAGESVVVSVHGADRPGTLARVATEIAAAGGNIVDVLSRTVLGSEGPSCVMSLGVDLAPGRGGDSLAGRLAVAAGELGVECTVAPAAPESR
ncbi:MAG TPA: ACT domain-containing protein [Acidimicrobiales bacterium]|nr:ACT domain-containing protein [Acidimicrobiales bacterium]